ncbi:MAG: hydantoinase/oxoprolinase family protein [Planctomycetes bacterium]|nr:hydantoinase/oxoprolinase family protein [Planctomycetota bacterium]MCB9917658.1 hydantoinase/oxoprolinase family protein [Planctomycetota bacterium]
MPRGERRRVGVDTGGTFTDLVQFDGREFRVVKTASTKDAPERAVLTAIGEAGAHGRDGDVLVHGSTVGLNALLTGTGARLAVVTNAGFEDILEIARQDRPDLYALHVEPRPVLVPRALRFGVHERRLADGTLREKVTARELRELRTRLADARVEAVAICLLHSYAHPEDELRIAHALRGLKVPIVCSASLLRRHREYERFSAACIDAFVRPVVARYLEKLASGARPLELFVVRNEGGTMPWHDAAEAPVRAILSGPAGGAAGVRFWAKRLGFDAAIGFDMGGTSADVAFVAGAESIEDEVTLGPHRLAMPSLPLTTVGTGGGSIAWRDAGGALRVGPQSAGADPGPACYGKGTVPTVSDAHLVLGRLPASGLLGGEFALHEERARKAIQGLAKQLGLNLLACAEGILEIADLQMARPLRSFTLGRGIDPKDVALVAFGGAGGLHAVRLARLVGFEKVIVPPMQGALSAFGMLLARQVFERECAFVRELDTAGAAELVRFARGFLAETKRHATTRASEARVFATLRYRGNQAEFWVEADRDAHERFEAEFERRFGFRQQLPIEALRVRARLILEPARDKAIARALAQGGEHTADRTAGRAAERKAVETSPSAQSDSRLEFVPRNRLRKRWRDGPFAVVDYSGTTIVERDSRARLTDGCIEIISR